MTIIIIIGLCIIGSITCIAQNRIVIDKLKFELIVQSNKGDTLLVMPCAVGLNAGQKEREGDMKTPEGIFSIASIENSSKWTHDFKDGYGKRKGAYGPWFIRLKTPKFKGIGIHGTCFPESIGKQSSEGCVRLRNEDLLKLVPYVKKGDIVIIHKGWVKPINIILPHKLDVNECSALIYTNSIDCLYEKD